MCCLKTSLLRLLIFAVSLWLISYGVRGFKDDKVWVKGHRLVSRSDSPAVFWLYAITYFIVGILGIVFALFPFQILHLISCFNR